MNQILLLIDNNCSNLNINNINDILHKHFSQNEISLNGQIIEKSLIANYIPVDTSKNYLNLSNYSWSDVTQFSEVIYLTCDRELRKDIQILALFYRILTGKSINLFINHFYAVSFPSFYPAFLNIYDLEKCIFHQLPEVTQIKNLPEFKQEIIKHFSQFVPMNGEFVNDLEHFGQIFLYILNGATDWTDFLKLTEIKSYNNFYDLEVNLKFFEKNQVKNEEFKYYDAQYTLYDSLGGKLQVSLPEPGQNKIYIFKSLAGDYNFRNLKFKNVFVSSKNHGDFLVVPFYKDEQSTRQTVRFLIMNLYKVFNNSVVVDYIVLYLFMKVSLLDDVLIKTKYENVARLFLKRHGKLEEQIKFLRDNSKYLNQWKCFFSELENFDDEELTEILVDFVSTDFKLVDCKFVKKFEVVYVEETEINQLDENELKIFPIENLSQVKTIEIDNSNWPKNLNFKCDPNKLQLNSSTPFFICTNSYEDFLAEIKEIKWMNTILKYTNKLVLKGGAILDLLWKKKPKDYDLMNIGMSNEEFIEFLIKFCKDEKPEKIEFIPNSVILFRLTLRNGDVLEIILNLDMNRDKLFGESHLPDQICFIPSENKLLANEATLWAMNYGYFQLEMEKHPKAIRVSSKMNKLGFNFYFNKENKSKFLKERLERNVWSISQVKTNDNPSYSERKINYNPRYPERKTNDKKEDVNENLCIISRGKIICNKKMLFANREAYLNHVQNLSVCEDDKDLVKVDFNGGFILPVKKIDPMGLANGLDWSF
ncbi:unnamed protein product [Brachionus calyciflorus]|uniref:Uncharacterized protein n=1 Tax=Brachionus calyciflorus TaxID=104777 RepID=A0A813WXU1_9BILA|nr:unnamed protein product [Brachionus calyciflorus]